MADEVSTQVLNDGPRNHIVKLTNISDGTDETLVTKVDASTLSGNPCSLRVDRVQYDLTGGMRVRLYFKNDGTDTEFLTLGAGQGDLDLRSVGGIPNPMLPGANGDILLTCEADSLEDAYSIILHTRKKY